MGKWQTLLTRVDESLKRTQPEEKKVRPTEGDWTDTEIVKATDDRFDFQDYAGVLARRAATADTPLTIGVFGRWGSGKTSLMRLIEAALSKEAKKSVRLRSIWINVWQLSNQDEVWHAFLQALFSKVHRELSLWRRIDKLKLLRQLASNSYRIVLVITPMIVGLLIAKPETGWGDALSLVLNPIAGGGTLVTVGLGLWTLAKPIIETARETVSFDLQAMLKYPPYEAQVTELMQLQERFKDMVEVLVGEDGRLVVFIDDLDRCTPDKVPEVLEAIKLFTTTPRCVYVLGLDHAIVRQGIETKYKFEEAAATEYLEKIVQIPFHLPPLDEGRVESFVHGYYLDLHEVCPTAPDVFSQGLEPNPRKVKRALNIYRTLLDLAEVRVKAWEMDPVDPELLAKMVVLQSRFSDLHGYFLKQPDHLALVEQHAIFDAHEAKGEKIEDYELDRELVLDPVQGADVFTRSEETRPIVDDLVAEPHRAALNALFAAGQSRFRHLGPGELATYIYLTGTAEGGAELVRPSREERNRLLGGDPAKIRDQVVEILKRGADEQDQQRITQAYIERLEGVLRDPERRYAKSERDSAIMALDRLEGRERQEFEPLTVPIPTGPFLMGSTDEQVKQVIADGLPEEWAKKEQPRHMVELGTYRIGRYPVTNAEYQAFVQETGHEPPQRWKGKSYPKGKHDHPVVYVSWHDAVAYCEWLSEKTGRAYRLPTEAEWEKAARGTDGRIYPWGNEWDKTKLNSAEAGPGHITPVGQYSPDGDSPYGAADMAGNVWEWVADWHGKGYYSQSPARNPPGPESGKGRVLRGGSWNDGATVVRGANRGWFPPLNRGVNVGFRCARGSQ